MLKHWSIRLPALPEQRRIVALLDALSTICDQLERSLATERVERARLLEALLRQALTTEAGGPRGSIPALGTLIPDPPVRLIVSDVP